MDHAEANWLDMLPYFLDVCWSLSSYSVEFDKYKSTSPHLLKSKQVFFGTDLSKKLETFYDTNICLPLVLSTTQFSKSMA